MSMVAACAWRSRTVVPLTVAISDGGKTAETRLLENGDIRDAEGTFARLDGDRVVDLEGHRIARLDDDGRIIDTFGQERRMLGDGSLQIGRDHITIDADGTVRPANYPVVVRNFHRGREHDVWLLFEAIAFRRAMEIEAHRAQDLVNP
jgi:hypothetical protein